MNETRKTQQLREKAHRDQGGLCYWCGKLMIVKTEENAAQVWDHPDVCTADHYPTPRSHGGRSVEGNVVAACRECNNRRHAAHAGGWPWLKSVTEVRIRHVGWGPW